MTFEPTLRRLLYVTSAKRFEAHALTRAYALANLTQAEFNVLVRLAPRSSLLDTLALPREGEGEFVAFVDAARRASAWCREVIGEQFDDECVALRVGDFAEAVAAHVEAIDADWIVVAAGEHSGSAITQLVREIQRPVLVARPERGKRAVIAASDLGNARLPVLQRALQLAQPLRAAVVLLHNMRPPRRWRRRSELQAGEHVRSRWLRLAGRDSRVRSTVLTRSRDAVEAILAQAREHHADIVVVGTHERSWFSRAVHRSVAAELINRAQRSVLVAPIA